jgi:hypothetical protein
MDKSLITVIETPTFIRRSGRLMTEADRKALIDHLAANPADGVELGSGVRKLRWSIAGRGKSGGVRVIHFFADARFPVIILDVFAKNEKANYAEDELATVRRQAKRLIGLYAKRSIT